MNRSASLLPCFSARQIVSSSCIVCLAFNLNARFRRTSETILIAYVLLFAVACGGSSGVSGQPDTAPEGELTVSSSDNIGVGDDEPGNLEDNNDIEPGDITEGNNEQDEVPVREGFPAIVGVGEPVDGAIGSILSMLEAIAVDPVGERIAFTGRLSTSTGNDPMNTSGIWSGPLDSPLLLAQSGSALLGVPDNTRFDSADGGLTLASDGSLGVFAKLRGAAGERSVYLVGGANGLRVLVGASDRLPGFSGELTLRDMHSAVRSPAGVALLATPQEAISSFTPTLWFWDGERFAPVANRLETSQLIDPNIPLLPMSGCRAFLPTATSPVYGLSDSGDVVFNAMLSSNPGTTPCSGSAVVRYRAGRLQIVVQDGDTVPGTQASTFAEVRLVSVAQNGDAIVRSTLMTSTGGSFGDRRWSFWRFAANGDAALLVLEGEAIDGEASLEALPMDVSEFFLGGHSSERLAARVTTRNGLVYLLAGVPRTDQPHAIIPVPGASTLIPVVSPDSAPPIGFPTSSYFSRLGIPSVGLDGAVYFWGTLADAVSNETLAVAVWRANLSGSVVPIASVGDAVLLRGGDEPLSGVSTGRQSRSDMTDEIWVTDIGDALVRGTVSPQFVDKAVLFRVPNGAR